MNKVYVMQLFIRIAELESFSHAIDTLGLPKGSVSRQVQALENHSGTQLLHRTTRYVQLMQDGMIYYKRVKDLLSNLDKLGELSHHNPSSISGELRVDMPVGIARSLVIPRLPSFLYQYPDLELELSSSDRLVGLTREDFDCVVRVDVLKGSGLVVHPLGKLTQINCVSPQCLIRSGYSGNLEDLVSHTMVHYLVNLGMHAQGFEVATENGTQWAKTGGMLAVNSIETYHVACLVSLGIIQVSRADVRNALCAGTLVEVLPQYRVEPTPIFLPYPRQHSLSRRVRLFIEWLTGMMKDYMD